MSHALHAGVDLPARLSQTARAVEATLEALLPLPEGPERRVVEAMRYAALGGGKRLRGFLIVEGAALCGAPRAGALRAASAIEMLHAYSLVHDDLPAMDDDDLRRGQPSCHRRFDEATAILAGDALQTRAFEVLADAATAADPAVRCRLIAAFALASGADGMVGGQMIDMEGETRRFDLDQVRRLHALKTGALIRFSAEAGAILADAPAAVRAQLLAYGRDIGTAFQVADDVLDATASAEVLGKTAGKDLAAGKSTFVSLLGIEGARAEAARLAEAAVGHLHGFGEEADALRALAWHMVERKS